MSRKSSCVDNTAVFFRCHINMASFINTMSIQSIAIASAKSFGDFVIAHSVLHRVKKDAKPRIRLISCSHVKGLNAILPDDVCVTLLNSGAERVPALFDVKKRGGMAAVRSALSLRREFRKIERSHNEALAFDVLGMRERFIAGDWPAIAPRNRGANIYETYFRFLIEYGIRTAAAPIPITSENARSVGIFPESRLIKKRLTAPTLSVIVDCIARAGLDAKLFILDGDLPPQGDFPCLTNISRNFASLASAIDSVDSVISSDSLPAHLAEYFGRPVFVASPFPNQYWLPYGSFTKGHWGIFGNTTEFSASLDKFLGESRG
jgi:hypothetical protein